MATLRFFIDEDPQQDLGRTLRQLGFDALANREAGTKGLSDARQLEFAVAPGRVFITCNAKDFAQIHEALVLWSRRHGTAGAPIHNGILIVPNGSRMGLDDVTRIVAEFAQRPDADRVVGRLFEWGSGLGWVERDVS